MTALRKPLHASARRVGRRGPFLPHIDAARTQRRAVGSIETAVDHGQYSACDGVEEDVRVAGGPDAEASAGRPLARPHVCWALGRRVGLWAGTV